MLSKQLALGLFMFVVFGCGGDNGAESITRDASNSDAPLPDARVRDVGFEELPEVCGEAGTVDERIASCSAQKCLVTVEGELSIAKCAGAHELSWQLVAKTEASTEVWLDVANGLIWSDDSLFVAGAMRELMLFCASPDQGQSAKGNLDAKFRLPTYDDFVAAIGTGITVVLPRISDVVYWTSTVYQGDHAWFFADGVMDHMPAESTDEYFRAHCVASML